MYYFKINLNEILEQEKSKNNYVKWCLEFFHFESVVLWLWTNTNGELKMETSFYI